VEKNLIEAYFWFSVAMRGGYDSYGIARNSITGKITSDQLKELRERIENWRPAVRRAQ
jgi:hypothetical protein